MFYTRLWLPKFLEIMYFYVYIYRTKMKVICLNMSVAVSSLSRVSYGNMIQAGVDLNWQGYVNVNFMNLLIHQRDFLHIWICLSLWMTACNHNLSLYTQTSQYIYSLLFSKHFLRCWQGEFFKQSRASLVGEFISFILLTLKFDPGMMLQGKIRCYV